MSDKKSFIAKIEEAILRFNKLDFMDSKEKVDDLLKNPPDNKVPKNIFKSIDFNGMQVFTFGDENAENAILYLHGGAYVLEVNYQHLLYCSLLSRKLNVNVLVPVYPLAPKHDVNEAFDAVIPLYEKLILKDKLILMGDSAGGGFAYSFCQYLKTIDLPQPNKIISFSPWVDVSMSNPPYNSEDDPILGEIGLREIGKSWAGELDAQDYRVSPLFGDNAGLPDTLIFAGTGEIFYRDIEKYVQNLKRDGVDVKLIAGEGLFHIYPLFPIPEAKKAFKEIKKEIID
jgi:acetyl esterase/lipase